MDRQDPGSDREVDADAGRPPARGGPVRFALRPGTSPAVQSHLSAALPDHEVTVVLMPAPEAVERLGTGDGVDVVLFFVPAGGGLDVVPAEAHVTTVVVEPVWVLVAAGHPLAEREEVSVREIVDHGLTWIISPSEDPLGHWERSLVLGRAPDAQVQAASDFSDAEIVSGRAVELTGPVNVPGEVFAARPLTPPATMHLYLMWQPDRLPGTLAGDLLAAVRGFMRDRAQQVPQYWRWILDHPHHFPGIAPGPAAGPAAGPAPHQPDWGPGAPRRGTGGPSGLSGLSERERQVLTLVATGLNDTEIAQELRLSPLTVSTHVRNARAKLGARDRVQLVVLAHRHGLAR